MKAGYKVNGKSIWVALNFLAIVFASMTGRAQEQLLPIGCNPLVQHVQHHPKSAAKTTALSLPFFDDFTTYNIFPDSSKWVENDQTYVNNTMCVSPVSRGVVTFDALSQYGIPYDTLSNIDERYCDSLTSQPIDMSGYGPGDSVYLSFFYQPQGNGFAPLAGDSLILLMQRNDGLWVAVWEMPGSYLQPFQQAMIPITDSAYFYSGFQFRFVNIGALNYSDAIWNVDYVRLNSGRNLYDTTLNDVAYTANPTFLLNNYTYMPYRQFMANPASELASQFTDSIRNNYSSYKTVNYGYSATELTTGTTLLSPTSGGSMTIAPGQISAFSVPTYTSTVPITGTYNKMIFENKFYLQSLSGSDPAVNDTIVQDQVFDNYLAFDDGSAERIYNLILSTTLPGEIQVEYYLNQPDTLRGLAIYFARQIPDPNFFTFSIAVYSQLAGIEGATSDNLLRQQDYCIAQYEDTINKFWVYKLDTPLALPAGTFYAGTIQPADEGVDTLNFGFDVNRVMGDNVYFKVYDVWEPSVFQGAIMMRPLLGQDIEASKVADVKTIKSWSVSPNPADRFIEFSCGQASSKVFTITDVQGRRVMEGSLGGDQRVNVSGLTPGMYLVNLRLDGQQGAPKKIIKQ